MIDLTFLAQIAQPAVDQVVEPVAKELAAPSVDARYVAAIASRALHILSAMILAGGLFYIKAVLAPSGSDACFGDRRAVWAKWVGIATFLLLATGIYNFIVINGAVKAEGGKLPPTYHMLFGIKFLLALVVMFIGAILAGKTAAADRFRTNMPKWLNLGWLAIIAIVILAGVMKTLH